MLNSNTCNHFSVYKQMINIKLNNLCEIAIIEAI